MNCKFINVLMFAAGAAIGSAVTWKIVKTRYERIAQEEIDSVLERFSNNEPDVAQEQSDENTTDDEEDRHECDGQINWSDLEDLDEEDEAENDEYESDMAEYVSLAEKYTIEKGGSVSMAKEPYVIAPYDFGELDGYRQFELTYYADDILEDEDYNIVKDIDELLGPKALTTFGEYEDDAVFVRNEQLCADFQILKDPRTYAEARSIGPKRVDDE